MAFDAWSQLYIPWYIFITQLKFHLSGWTYQNTAPAVASHQKRPWGWQDYAQTWNKANFRKHNTQECQVTSLFHCINIFTPKVCWKSSNPRYFCFTVFRIVPDLRKLYFHHKFTRVYHLFWSAVGFPSFSITRTRRVIIRVKHLNLLVPVMTILAWYALWNQGNIVTSPSGPGGASTLIIFVRGVGFSIRIVTNQNWTFQDLRKR